MIQKILIANRGEIAVRIIRTCREMGIETIAVYSEVDKDSLHVRLADEAYCIGKSRSEESYLRFYQIVSLALKHGAQAIHPGYGFLSENEEFAALCSSMKVIFIGPSASAIAKMGDKAVARRTMSDAGVQVPQGSNGAVDSLKKAISIARQVGYPLLLKPSAGGGGKGMRVVRSEEELKQALQAVAGEYTVGEQHIVGNNPAVQAYYPLRGQTGGGVEGWIVSLLGIGYGGEMKILAGYELSGEIFSAILMDNQETPGLGKKAEKPEYMKKFIGTGEAEPVPTSKDQLTQEQADAVTGATITFVGIGKAIGEGSTFVSELGGEQ